MNPKTEVNTLNDDIEIDTSLEEMAEVIILIVLVSQSFVKVMFFLRVFDQFGFMVQMVGLTLIDVAPFISFYFLFMLYFALVNMIMKIKIDPDN